MKTYGIERRFVFVDSRYEYRFYSLFNGMRGAWTSEKEKAIESGEIHQKLIEKLLNEPTDI